MRHSLLVRLLLWHCVIRMLAPTFASASMRIVGRLDIFDKAGLGGLSRAWLLASCVSASKRHHWLNRTVSSGFNSLASCRDEDGNQM